MDSSVDEDDACELSMDDSAIKVHMTSAGLGLPHIVGGPYGGRCDTVVVVVCVVHYIKCSERLC